MGHHSVAFRCILSFGMSHFAADVVFCRGPLTLGGPFYGNPCHSVLVVKSGICHGDKIYVYIVMKE